MTNIYYDPEKFGLEIVGEVEFSDRSYQFNTFVVWRNKLTGDLYYAQDSGCSCPSPFEGHGLGSEDSIQEATPHQIAEAVNETLDKETRWYDDPVWRPSWVDAANAATVELIGKVMK